MFSARNIGTISIIGAMAFATGHIQAQIQAQPAGTQPPARHALTAANTLMNEQILDVMPSLSAHGIEVARYKCLNEKKFGNKCTWEDAGTHMSGYFQVTNTYMTAAKTVCLDYFHSIRSTNRQNLPGERSARLVKDDTVCLQAAKAPDGKDVVDWLSFKDDRRALVVEYRIGSPDVLGPQRMADLMTGFKAYKTALDNAKKEEHRKYYFDELSKWTTQWMDSLKTANKKMAIGQLPAVLEVYESETIRLKLVQLIKIALDVHAGDPVKVLSLFQDEDKRAEVDSIIKQLKQATNLPAPAVSTSLALPTQP